MSAKEKKRLIDSLTEAHLAVRATLDKVDLEIPVYKDSVGGFGILLGILQPGIKK